MAPSPSISPLSQRRLGRPRQFGSLLVASIFTLGLYWYVWLGRAFHEVARWRGQRSWAPALAFTLAVANYGIIAFFLAQADLDARDPWTHRFTIAGLSWPWMTSLIGAILAEAVVRAVALRRLTVTLGHAAREAGLPQWGQAPVGKPWVFALMEAVAFLPFYGRLLVFAGAITRWLWAYECQALMNEVWRSQAPATSQEATPSPTGAASGPQGT